MIFPCNCYKSLGHPSSRLGILFQNSTHEVALHLPRYEVLIGASEFFKFYSTLLKMFCRYSVCSRCHIIFELLNSFLQLFERGGVHLHCYWSFCGPCISIFCSGIFLDIIFVEEVIKMFIPSCQYFILITNDSSILSFTYVHTWFKFFLTFRNFTVQLSSLPAIIHILKFL